MERPYIAMHHFPQNPVLPQSQTASSKKTLPDDLSASSWLSPREH